jgi:hypothetical protein
MGHRYPTYIILFTAVLLGIIVQGLKHKSHAFAPETTSSTTYTHLGVNSSVASATIPEFILPNNTELRIVTNLVEWWFKNGTMVSYGWVDRYYSQSKLALVELYYNTSGKLTTVVTTNYATGWKITSTYDSSGNCIPKTVYTNIGANVTSPQAVLMGIQNGYNQAKINAAWTPVFPWITKSMTYYELVYSDYYALMRSDGRVDYGLYYP